MRPYKTTCVKHHPFRGKLGRTLEVTATGFRTLTVKSGRVTNDWKADALVAAHSDPSSATKFSLVVRSSSAWSRTYTMVFEVETSRGRDAVLAALRGSGAGVPARKAPPPVLAGLMSQGPTPESSPRSSTANGGAAFGSRLAPRSVTARQLGARGARAAEATAAAVPQPGDFMFGGALGEGAYAFVARCKHRVTGKEYACKVMSKDFIMRKGKIKYVLTEKNVLMKLSNPNIVRLWYAFRDEQYFYLIMDLCPNGTLLRAIRYHAERALADGRVDEACPLATAQTYAAEIVDALAYLHSMRLAHRDLKPENILIDAAGHLKLTDFATAKLIPAPEAAEGEGGSAAQYGRRRSNTFCGTAEYVAPEVLRGGESDEGTGDAARAAASDVGLGVDIWAFGCMLFQILSGCHPFQGPTEYLTYQLILGHAPPLPDESRRLLDPLGETQPKFPLRGDEDSGRSFVFRACMTPEARGLLDATLQSVPARRLPAALLSSHSYFDSLAGCAADDTMEQRHEAFAALSEARAPPPPPRRPAKGSRLQVLDGDGEEPVWRDEVGTVMAIAAVGRSTSGPRTAAGGLYG